MSCVSRNTRLPSEILKLVLQKLGKKEDRKACLLVCKSWNVVAQEYFSRDISIKVERSELETLQNDIQHFGQNVKTIKLKGCRSKGNENEDEPTWRNILSLCPYLNSVYFLECYGSSMFLETLQNPDLRLNDLQKIDIKELTSCSLNIHNLCLQINVQYCKTITSLQLCSAGEDFFAVKYGGLCKLISLFPQLTCLKLIWRCSVIRMYTLIPTVQSKPIVNLNKLLDAAPLLEEVRLYDCNIIACDSVDTNTTQPTKNESLTKLKIIADAVTINTLRYIFSLLKEVKTLVLVIGNITVDGTITEKETKALLGDLEAYISKMKRAEIKYKCGDHDFYFSTDKESRIKNRLNTYCRYGNYLSSDDENNNFSDDDDDDDDYDDYDYYDDYDDYDDYNDYDDYDDYGDYDNDYGDQEDDDWRYNDCIDNDLFYDD